MMRAGCARDARVVQVRAFSAPVPEKILRIAQVRIVAASGHDPGRREAPSGGSARCPRLTRVAIPTRRHYLVPMHEMQTDNTKRPAHPGPATEAEEDPMASAISIDLGGKTVREKVRIDAVPMEGGKGYYATVLAMVEGVCTLLDVVEDGRQAVYSTGRIARLKAADAVRQTKAVYPALQVRRTYPVGA